MNLYILRHASAGMRRANPILDVKRPLDKEGKKHSLYLAYLLNNMKVSFDLVISSPLKRSLQTAQLVATETGHEQNVMISNGLAPSATFAQFQRLLKECEGHENVLVVGHNPNITEFLSKLTSGEEGSARIRLSKGSLARLSLTRGPATMRWLISPSVVRALYTTSTKSSRRKTSRK